MLEDLPENALTERIIGCAIEVHRTYGGLGSRSSPTRSRSSGSCVRPA